MEVHVAPGSAPVLTAADDLRRFSVMAAATPDAQPALAEALAGVLAFEGAGPCLGVGRLADRRIGAGR